MIKTGEGIDISTGRALLASVEIASPCPLKWDDMVGDERERFCRSCQLKVYNISSMTTPEAEVFLRSRLGEERTCVQLYRRQDGTIMTDDCPRALRPLRDTAVGTSKRLARCAQVLVILFLGASAPAWAQKQIPNSVPEGAAGGIRPMPLETITPPVVENATTGNAKKHEPVSVSVRARVLKKNEVKPKVETVCGTPPPAVPAPNSLDELTESERTRLSKAMALLTSAPAQLSAGSMDGAELRYANAAALLSTLPRQTHLLRFALQQDAKLLRVLRRDAESMRVEASLGTLGSADGK